MKRYISEDTKNFKTYWNTLERGKKKAARKKIMDACYVEYTTVTNWLLGYCNIPPLAKEKIEQVFGEEIFKWEE